MPVLRGARGGHRHPDVHTGHSPRRFAARIWITGRREPGGQLDGGRPFRCDSGDQSGGHHLCLLGGADARRVSGLCAGRGTDHDRADGLVDGDEQRDNGCILRAERHQHCPAAVAWGGRHALWPGCSQLQRRERRGHFVADARAPARFATEHHLDGLQLRRCRGRAECPLLLPALLEFPERLCGAI